MLVRILLSLALAAAAAMTLGGMLAPIYPAADFLNHFRPFMLVGAGAVLAGSAAVRARWPARAGAVLVALNAILFALPLLWSANDADGPVPAHASAAKRGRDLKVVTFNSDFIGSLPLARFLLAEDADVVVLQEISLGRARELHFLTREKYPYAGACQEGCGAAILAKRPWVAFGAAPRTEGGPDLVWAQFDDPEIGRFRIVGVHAARPLNPEDQARQVERLIALRGSLDGPVILAGDFNMTPWSYRLQRLLAFTGLRRHATFLRSWPSQPRAHLPVPVFLIDHVLTTPDIRSVSIRAGPNVGSDHLPIVAELRLPAS